MAKRQRCECGAVLKNQCFCTTETCANCKREFRLTQLGALSDAIGRKKPACSYECNKALGQVR